MLAGKHKYRSYERKEYSMKMYKKEELTVKDGLLVAGNGDVVLVNPEVVDLANELETNLQKARYLSAQPKGGPAPTLDGFTRKSTKSIEMFTCDTPISDKRAEDALAFMDELDDIKLTDDMNNMLLGMTELVMFVQEGEVLGLEGCTTIRRFDTPTLGNPLKWTEDTLSKAVAEIHGCSVDESNDGESE